LTIFVLAAQVTKVSAATVAVSATLANYNVVNNANVNMHINLNWLSLQAQGRVATLILAPWLSQ
jgi:hypothetical protein